MTIPLSDKDIAILVDTYASRTLKIRDAKQFSAICSEASNSVVSVVGHNDVIFIAAGGEIGAWNFRLKVRETELVYAFIFGTTVDTDSCFFGIADNNVPFCVKIQASWTQEEILAKGSDEFSFHGVDFYRLCVLVADIQ